MLYLLLSISRIAGTMPPTNEKRMTKQNTIIMVVSSTPTRISLPHGAGKWPIMYT